MNAYLSSQLGSALNCSVFSPTKLNSLGDQFGELRDKLYDAFRDEATPKLSPLLPRVATGINVRSAISERDCFLARDFLTDQADVGRRSLRLLNVT